MTDQWSKRLDEAAEHDKAKAEYVSEKEALEGATAAINTYMNRVAEDLREGIHRKAVVVKADTVSAMFTEIEYQYDRITEAHHNLGDMRDQLKREINMLKSYIFDNAGAAYDGK